VSFEPEQLIDADDHLDVIDTWPVPVPRPVRWGGQRFCLACGHRSTGLALCSRCGAYMIVESLE
jgi:hypothetical protein